MIKLNSSDITGDRLCLNFVLHDVFNSLFSDGPSFGKLFQNISIPTAELSNKQDEVDYRELASKYERGFLD